MVKNKIKRIAFVGAGKAAWSVVNAFVKCGLNVSCIVSRSAVSAKTLAEINKIESFSADAAILPQKADVIFITTSDDQIKNVTRELSLLDFDFKNSVFAHISGTCTSTELEMLENKGAAVASFHIMQTFPSKAAVDLNGCYAAVETKNPAALELLDGIAKTIGVKPFNISAENKPMYHLSAVMASNFMTANIFNAVQVFKNTGIKGAEFIDIMKPLLERTLTNILCNGLSDAVSGPAERGDVDTVRKHIEILKDSGNELLTGYILNSLSLLRLLFERNGTLTKAQSLLKNFLERELKDIT
jgi:predicted short-subunit dehydrogenase-like oxidoreductase (DUF2520 family)